MGISNELTRLQQTLVVVYSRPDPKAPGSADLFCDLYQKRVLLWNRNATGIALLAYSPLGDRSAAEKKRADRDSKKWREKCPLIWPGFALGTFLRAFFGFSRYFRDVHVLFHCISLWLCCGGDVRFYIRV